MLDWKMSPATFFELFIEELRLPHTEVMRQHYKYLEDDNKRYHFRKNYFLRRLEYIQDQVGAPGASIWDCGCGYGTQSFFLALNGFTVRGTTIEDHYDHVRDKRLEYWAQIGDISGFTYVHEDLFSRKFPEPVYDTILVQDTLHHVEPIDEAFQILHRALKHGGRLIAVEENGTNLIKRIMLYKQRGNRRIIEIYDEGLDKTITFGNENTRSLPHWRAISERNGFHVKFHEYIRVLPPFMWSEESFRNMQEREKNLSRRSGLLCHWLYWGLNFILVKNTIENGKFSQ